ncbi:MAG TPA: heavy metal-binding domain-containing protein, partial [Micromonosporaceae bacterium]|nr:heavy metal-binding domain-containing protein [Micromonosporaceae bacterium]
LGANAVLGMQFEHREVGEMWMEVCAYGTAVVVHRLAPDPRTITPPPPPEPFEPPDVAESASAPELSTAAETPTPTEPP